MDKKCLALHKETSKPVKEYAKRVKKTCIMSDDYNRNSSKRKDRLERRNYLKCTGKIADDLGISELRAKFSSECSDWNNKKMVKLFRKQTKCYKKKCPGNDVLRDELDRKLDRKQNEECKQKTRKLRIRCRIKLSEEMKKNNPSYVENARAKLRCQAKECAKEESELNNQMMQYLYT